MKIIATDFDGTLNYKGITDNKRRAIARWRKAGNLFGIVSGRGTKSLGNVIDDKNFEYDFLICNNGGVVCDSKMNRLSSVELPAEIAFELVEDLKEWGCPFALIDSSDSITVQFYEESMYNGGVLLGKMPCNIEFFNQVSTILPSPEEAIKVIDKINSKYSGVLTAHQNGGCIDIVPNGVNKASGIYNLLEVVGGKFEDVITVGDNINDFHMIDEFRSYAMANGVGKIKSTADYITTGIAEIINFELKGSGFLKTINTGVYPTMVTPFTAENKVDFVGVLQLLDWYKSKGVDGIFAICQSSEIFFLSFEERLELIKFIMANKPEGMSIVASGHTSDDLDTQIEEAKAFIETGIDAYVFISNRFAKADESDDILLKNMEYVASALPEIPLGVYECPYPYKRELSPYVMQKMVESGKYLFIKDTCCSTEKLKEKLDIIKDSSIMLFNANAATLLDSLKMGALGYSGVMANFHPELYSALIKAYNENDMEKAEFLQNLVGFFSVAECQCYPVNAKYYINLDGVNIGIKTRTRNEAELTESRKLEIEQMYAFTNEIKKKYNLK